MQQITWRAPDELAASLRAQASHLQMSMNEYLTRIVQAATDPAFAESLVEEIRARLRLAGLLAESSAPPATIPDPETAAAARRRAGSGTPLSDIVLSDR